MKQIATLAISIFLFIGIVGAVNTNPVPTYNAGHQSGDKFPGVVEASYGTIDNNLYVGGDQAIAGTLTAAVLTAASTVSGHLAADLIVDDLTDITAATGAEIFNYAASTGAFTTSQGTNTLTGNVVHSKTVAYSQNATTTVATVLTSASTKTTYEIDASGADATITLPDAATVSGRLYYIGIKTDPGSYYARIKATAGKFGGASGIAAATGLKDTDATGGITLLSDGTDYLIVGQYFPVGGAGWVSG